MKLILYGRATVGQALYQELRQKHDIVAITDDYVEEEGELFGVPVLKPDKCLRERATYDAVVVASLTGLEPIRQHCLDFGVPEHKIITSYVEGPIESRKTFLKNMAEILSEYEQEADVAEVGVFQGEFARWINTWFPQRTLHLFDTFEGFDPRDSDTELTRSFSAPQAAIHLSDTSVERVLNKMPHPEQCRVYKGFFPETAQGIRSKFCFVNLDLDLYDPTYQGLCFFQDKMTEHGVILIHDYYFYTFHNSDTYKGVKAAVDRFLRERGGTVCKYPIGDGISILLAGKWS